jgi:hypothetical protein
MQSLKSVGKQDNNDMNVFIGMSTPHSAFCSNSEYLIRVLNQKRPGPQYHVLNDGSKQKSQFEHLRDLLALSDSVNKQAWLMFLDNDGMMHPARVRVFRKEAARVHTLDPNRIAFNC